MMGKTENLDEKYVKHLVVEESLVIPKSNKKRLIDPKYLITLRKI